MNSVTPDLPIRGLRRVCKLWIEPRSGKLVAARVHIRGQDAYVDAAPYWDRCLELAAAVWATHVSLASNEAGAK